MPITQHFTNIFTIYNNNMPTRKRSNKRRKLNNSLTKNDVRKIVLGLGETKFREVSFDSQIVSSDVPVLTELTDIDQGNDVSNRIGNKITIDNIIWKMTASSEANVTLTSNFRFIVAQSKRGNLLAGSFPAYNEGINLDTMWPIFDSLTIMASDGGPVGTNLSNTLHAREKEIEYLNNVGSSEKSNPIYMFMVSDILAASTEPVADGFIRINYKDI